MGGAAPPLLYAAMAWTRNTFTFFNTYRYVRQLTSTLFTE